MGRGMRVLKRCLIMAMLVPVLVFSGLGRGRAQRSPWPTDPVTNHGKPWRLGYLEGGPWPNYLNLLEGMMKAMMDLGWLVPRSLPVIDPYPGDTRKLWHWAATHITSRYLKFVDDAYWSCGWDAVRRREVGNAVIKRLNSRRDIDLMIAMGTWAGLDLANNRHHTPTLVSAVSDPLAAGLIRSYTDSGYDHVHVWVHPQSYTRRIKLFHDVYHFKRLGLAYEDSPTGRSYAGLKRVEQVARELDFQLVTCAMAPDPGDQRLAFEEIMACHRQLAPQVDAMLVTPYPLIAAEAFRKTLQPFYRRRIPTFSLGSTVDVQNGVLMGISGSLGEDLGLFEVATMAKIFHGATPRSLEQVFELPLGLVINMAVAKKYQLIPPDWALEFIDNYYFSAGGEGE